MGSPHEILKTVLLQLQCFWSRETFRRHADILDMTDLIALGQTGVMHSPRIPEHKVSGLHVDLDQLTALGLEPFQVFLVEKEEVHVLELGGRSIFVVILLTLLGEELVEELG